MRSAIAAIVLIVVLCAAMSDVETDERCTATTQHWLDSINRWWGLRNRMVKCNVTGLPAGVGKRDEDMIRWYNEHNERIREFVVQFPSHRLIEVDIEDRHAGRDLERAFGISRKCWGQRNIGLH